MQLYYMSTNLKTPEFCFAAVQQNGWALRYVPAKLKNPELCLAAVQQNGWALQFVPEELKTEEICRIAAVSVFEADVVITSPTRIAVVLLYRSSDMDAPQTVAKGDGLLAEKIKKLADNSKVPVIENQTIAQSLYKIVEVGQAIPRETYRAVAEILVKVHYKQNNKKP